MGRFRQLVELEYQPVFVIGTKFPVFDVNVLFCTRIYKRRMRISQSTTIIKIHFNIGTIEMAFNMTSDNGCDRVKLRRYFKKASSWEFGMRDSTIGR